jgi:CheY-like chemotaxis protein
MHTPPASYSGPETAKVMRARGFAGLIIGVTGHYLKEDIDDFIKCGANAVLSKPLNFVEMKSLIQDLLLVGSTSATSPSHL